MIRPTKRDIGRTVVHDSPLRSPRRLQAGIITDLLTEMSCMVQFHDEAAPRLVRLEEMVWDRRKKPEWLMRSLRMLWFKTKPPA